MVEVNGFEPMTYSLQSYRSSSWAIPPIWWAWEDLNFRPHAYQACALTTWATSPQAASKRYKGGYHLLFERRWSSRRFPYGYLVTTSPQSLTPPWLQDPKRLSQHLQVEPIPMVWRAVCTRPGNVFTAACWSAITSDSSFMHSSCRVQSELRQFFEIR